VIAGLEPGKIFGAGANLEGNEGAIWQPQQHVTRLLIDIFDDRGCCFEAMNAELRPVQPEVVTLYPIIGGRKMALSRRTLVKLTGATLALSSIGAIGFGGGAMALAASVRPFKLTSTTETRNTCPYCSWDAAS
jgi:hypothetical protein